MAGLNDLASAVSSRFTTNVATSFSKLTAQQWIRLIALVGAYMLLRPYLLRLGGRIQMRQHEAEEKRAAEEAAAIAAGEKPVLTANDLRGTGPRSGSKIGVSVPDSDEDESEDEAAAAGPASGTDWGRNARKRQRRVLRKLVEAHEQKLADEQADEEDKEIAEFLVD